MDSVTMNLVSSVVPENQGSAHAARAQPKMSLVFGPWSKTEFFVNAGTGLHSNDARGVINKIDPTSLSVAGSSGPSPAAAVPALVGSHGAEIGLRSELIPGLQTSLALWRLNSDSELVYSADADNGSTSPNGASRRYGLEWNNSLALSSSLLVDASLAWTHARFAQMNDNGSTGELIPNAVSKTALIAATWRHGPWSGGINWRYIGPYPLTQDGAQTAQGSIVTNLRLQRALTPKLDLSVDVLNLFNRQYYDIAYSQDYQTSPDTSTLNLNGITVHPGEPRQLRVGLRMRF
jgi:outer membrane receptor protein involved in Fe transport